ncbi:MULTISPECIES: hypothetical protein [unclassified Mesorhizobium]|uniref:hypothetical protein n=1 Tax=unclassified Mesorhizobium TaxID=325217 RepID=UPI003014214C
MSLRIPDFDAHDGCYFERVPEKLVLEGYRRWMAGFETGSVAPWELTFTLYTELLGGVEGRRALGELSHYVRTLRQCAACPLRSFPFGAHHICRDECMTLGLIAAIQHNDDGAARACLGAMACTPLHGPIGEAAASFAEILSGLQQFLLPIPQGAIEDVLSRAAPRATVH